MAESVSLISLILSRIRSLPAYSQALTGAGTRPLGLPRAARLPVLAALYHEWQQPILLITDRADHALTLFDEFAFWLPETPRFLFAEPAPLFYEKATWGLTVRQQRLQTLAALAAYHLPFLRPPAQPPLILSSVRALMTRTLPRRDFLKACRKLTPGQHIAPETLLRSWSQMGYQRVDTVLDPGQFSHRGGLLDIWPITESAPVRLDFFGNEIESLRQFDPASQRTLTTLDAIVISPAREYLLNEANALSEEWSEFHIPVLHPLPASLLDYLPQGARVVADDLSRAEAVAHEVEEQAIQLRRESIEEGTLPADFPIPYLTWPEVLDSLGERPIIELGRGELDDLQDLSTLTETYNLAAQFRPLERFAGRLKPFVDYLTGLVQLGKQVIVASRQKSRLEELWRQTLEHAPELANLAWPVFLDASLSDGWQLGDLYLITDSEIFGWKRPAPRARPRPLPETPEAIYADLQVGDLVVHVDHGIGRFVGLVRRSLEGYEREFLAVEYENGDTLFVPVHQADRLTRYVGVDNTLPALDRLGGHAWSERKNRAREAAYKVAEEMLELYARRHITTGHAFSLDTPWQRELEESFPYVETEDQLRALAEIKRDMESPRPMDRLLCGDVGYGKTEIAVRAAFKAVMDGKQVAVLVPTTVLAQQHYETFRQRLAAFPVTVEMLSRFRTPKEQEDILIRLALGAVDIVIGTHRLLSSDVQFKDLGLVIIDEEQRFGVIHKEHFKKLRTEVDVLTLTATPIPRTLYMALTGVRDISTLNTPPEERQPVVTHVGPYSPRLVRQAILRELERGGQVFFVHNRVHTIQAMQAHLQHLVPEARIAIAHGQMPEHELSEVMRRFASGEIDVLLSTSIIESGLDFPNANTLIVDRADTFGLAQLYQLRGRVGRGAVRAYAYFFRHNKILPTPEGQARLDVIAENTQLGAGFSIAMRDLEIRGAGELLGTRQHGFIQDVGFHLYTRLLADAVRRLRAEYRRAVPTPPEPDRPTPAFDLPLALPVNVDLPLAIGIPPEYIPDSNLRLRLYRRIADLRDEAEIDALQTEFQDRFGPLPDMVANLFYQMRVKLRAEKVGLAAVTWEGGRVALRFPPPPEGVEPQRFSDLAPDVKGGKNVYWVDFTRNEHWMPRLLEILDLLSRTAR